MDWKLASNKPPEGVITVLIMYQGDFEFGMSKDGWWRVYINSEWQVVTDQKNVTHWCLLDKPEI